MLVVRSLQTQKYTEKTFLIKLKWNYYVKLSCKTAKQPQYSNRAKHFCHFQTTHTHTIKSCSVSKCIIIYNVWNVNIFIMIVKVIKLSQWTNWQHWSLAMMIDAQMKSELKQHPTTTMSTQNSGNSSHADSQPKQQHPQKKLAA